MTGYNFAGRGKKAALGSAFLSLVETGRFKYWADKGIDDEDGGHGLSDAEWFWAQVRACSYEIPPDGRFDTDLRWEVPPSHKTDTPEGPKPTHDDRLLSAALVAEMDRLIRTGTIVAGTAESAVIPAVDPLGGDVY